MRQSDSKLIRTLPLFCGMSEANFDELMSAAFLQRFPKHLALITEGGLPDFLHIVVEGSVEMFCVYDGQEITIEIMQPVTTFILAAVIRDDVYLTSARTLTPAQVLMIPAEVVRRGSDEVQVAASPSHRHIRQAPHLGIPGMFSSRDDLLQKLGRDVEVFPC